MTEPLGFQLRNILPSAHLACLMVVEKSQIEGAKHQDNTDVRDQPLPESIPKEQEIHTHNNGYQHCNVNDNRYGFCHA